MKKVLVASGVMLLGVAVTRGLGDRPADRQRCRVEASVVLLRACLLQGIGQPAAPDRIRPSAAGRRSRSAAVDGEGDPVRAREAVQLQGRQVHGRLPVVRRLDRADRRLGRGQVHLERPRYANDRTVMGVLGTFNTGCAKLILPIINRAPGGPIAMISSANTGVGLTHTAAWTDPGEPKIYYPTGQAELRPRRDRRRLPGPRCRGPAEDAQEDEGLRPPRQPGLRQGRRQRVPGSCEEARHQGARLRGVGRQADELRGDR